MRGGAGEQLGRWSGAYGRKPPYARMTGTWASIGKSAIALRANAFSTLLPIVSSKPLRCRLDPISTVPAWVDSTTPDVRRSASPLATAPT